MNRPDQPDLFGTPPTEGAYGLPPPDLLAAAADPATSHAAAAEHVESGRRSRNADTVLRLVREHPGSTSVELYAAEGHELDRHEISRRLADLAAAGLVVQGAARECKINNRQMVTWWPVLSRS